MEMGGTIPERRVYDGQRVLGPQFVNTAMGKGALNGAVIGAQPMGHSDYSVSVRTPIREPQEETIANRRQKTQQ